MKHQTPPKVTKEEIVMHRFGELFTETTAFNQCKATGHHRYKYLVKMYCQNKLDHNGFLIDNRVINKAIQNCFLKMDSCEKLCIHFADTLEEVIFDHGVILDRLYVYLEPIVEGIPDPLIKNYAAFELDRTY